MQVIKVRGYESLSGDGKWSRYRLWTRQEKLDSETVSKVIRDKRTRLCQCTSHRIGPIIVLIAYSLLVLEIKLLLEVEEEDVGCLCISVVNSALAESKAWRDCIVITRFSVLYFLFCVSYLVNVCPSSSA